MSETRPRPVRMADPVAPSPSRRRFLARLGWGTAAAGLVGAGPLPSFGELKLPGLGTLVARGEIVEPRGTDVVRLNSNENPYGMCGPARQRMNAEAHQVNRYPFRWESELHERLAAVHGVTEDHIALGAGSTEILRMAAAAWTGPRGALVQADPTFETLGSYAREAGHEVRSIPLDREGRHDLQRMAAAIDDAVSVVYVCNPSNPASTLVAQADLDAFLDALPAHVIALVDEAYHDFVDAPDYRSQIGRAARSDNLVAIRTFSKIYGMAGLRVGYAVASPRLIKQLTVSRTQMSISVLGAACAAESLRDDEYPRKQQRLNAEARDVLVDALMRMDLPVWESQTNFVMTDLGRPMLPVNQAMAERGVLVGRLFPALPNHLRISIGTPAQMQRCVEVLEAVLA